MNQEGFRKLMATPRPGQAREAFERPKDKPKVKKGPYKK